MDDRQCYQVLNYFNEKIVEITGEHWIEFITDIDEAPSLEDLDGSKNKLIVFDDDNVGSRKEPREDVFRGRQKYRCDITQRYALISKVVRDNCNLLCAFNGVDTYTLQHIHTWCSDMTYNLFMNLF